MEIIYFGDGEWAHKAFDRILLDRNFDLKKVIIRHDTPDDVLKQKAKDANIEVLCPSNVNDRHIINQIKNIGAHLGVSMSYNQIIKKNLMSVFPKGIINCHAGKLPCYRGRNVLNWALINGEKEIGITCHYVDEGVDTGDIILQKTFPVTLKDDYGTVLKKSVNLCPEVLIEAMHLINNGEDDPRPQPTEGTYYMQRKDGDEFIDWKWPSHRIYNFVRAITTPGPCARSWVQIKNKFHLVIIKKVCMIANSVAYNCTPGGVVGRSERGYPLVKTDDTYLELVSYSIEHESKKKLNAGDRLGINHDLRLLQQYRTGNCGRVE